jgi:hypothetical protein
MLHASEEGRKIDVVLCSAINCIYNDCNQNTCTAAHVHIGNQGACCTGETCCKTFKLK